MARSERVTWTGASHNRCGIEPRHMYQSEAGPWARPSNRCIRTEWNADGDGGRVEWQPRPGHAASWVKYQHCQVENRRLARGPRLLGRTAKPRGWAKQRCEKNVPENHTVCLFAWLYIKAGCFYPNRPAKMRKTKWLIFGVKLRSALIQNNFQQMEEEEERTKPYKWLHRNM